MKKKYEKPIFVFEDFSLNTSIAGDCGLKTDTPSRGECAYILRSGHHVFFSSMADICTKVEDDGDYNGICYHVPLEASNLFNS